MTDRLSYRLLTGAGDRAFCERVSRALEDGYVLYGSPVMSFDGEKITVGQAVVLPAAAAGAQSEDPRHSDK